MIAQARRRRARHQDLRARARQVRDRCGAPARVARRRRRAEVLVGDVCDMDLGLSSHRVPRADEGADVDPPPRRHLLHGRRRRDRAAREPRRHAQRARARARRVAARARRALVDRDGVGRSPRHGLRGRPRSTARSSTTRTSARSTRPSALVRGAMRRLPITVMRPSIIVGDSATGEIDKLDGPYYLMVLIATNALRPAPAAARPRRHAAPPRADRLRRSTRRGTSRARRRRRQDVPHRRSEPAHRARACSRRSPSREHREAARPHPAPARARGVAHARARATRRAARSRSWTCSITRSTTTANTAQALAGTTRALPCPRPIICRALVRYVLDVSRNVIDDVPELDDVADPLD